MWQSIKRRFRSKTYLFNHFVAVFGIVELNFNLLQSALGDRYGYAFIGVAIGGYVLREMTKVPLAEK